MTWFRWFGWFFLLGVVVSWAVSGRLSPIAIALAGMMIALGSLSSELGSAPAATASRASMNQRIVADRSDPLLRLRVEWLADDRPAYETVDAFEADVERVLKGQRSNPPRSDRTVAATPRLAKQYDVPLARMAILDGDDDPFPF